VGGGSPGDANSGQVLVTMKDRGYRGIDPSVGHELTQKEFMELCRKKFSASTDLRVKIQDLSKQNFQALRADFRWSSRCKDPNGMTSQSTRKS